MSNILFFHNGTASHKWRIGGVAERANRETEHAIYVTSHMNWNKSIVDADLVIIEMLASPDIVETCHQQGAKVIYEADDAFIDSYGNERKNLQKLTDSHRKTVIDVINKVDALTVTNETLKKNYSRFTDKPIYVLPNYIDLEWYGTDKLNIERTTDEIRIGWFGSHGHLEDLQMVIPALNEVLDKYKNTKLIYCGFGGMSSNSLATEAGWGEDVFKDIPRERREFYPGVREDFWPMKHRFLDLDIGIAPLVDDYFNACKTPIKWMEYGVLKTPSVCSPLLYKDVITHGDDGLIARNHKEWVNLLSDLIEDKEFRKEMGDRAFTTVTTKHNLDNHWSDFLDVYNKVLL
jgi:glycosyltransferase involved in cell wall biosynthesis